MTLEQLRKLSIPELERLAEDLRQRIISICLKNGGHLGASLGAVELSLALHSEFNSPEDALVWDVGHQAYAHKLLTGRWDAFDTLRQENGMSGFLSRTESPHDIFGAGHSSTSISVALAIAWSNAQKKNKNWSIAIIGDGGLTAGLAQEALGNLKSKETGPLLIVLNDNQMSISENVGGISQILSSGRAREFFDLYGADYIGPIEGHDLANLKGTLSGIRAGYRGKPIVLHVMTQKGRGYSPAEENPAGFHGVSPVKAKVAGITSTPQKSWSDVFGESLCAHAELNDRIVAITAAMSEGTGLGEFANRFRDRFFDVGIAEPHAVTFAAGLATQGWKPVVAIYSTFLQRGIDQIIHDVAIQNLPVIFAIDRAGLVGADGPTHHGNFDLAYLQMIPGMRIFAPECASDLDLVLGHSLKGLGPAAIRYPRGGALEKLAAPLKDGIRIHQKAKNPKVIAVGVGVAGQRLAQAAREIDPDATKITTLTCVQIKPFPRALLKLVIESPDATLFTVEEGSILGGFGKNLSADYTLGYGDEFFPHGSPKSLENKAGVSLEEIKNSLLESLE